MLVVLKVTDHTCFVCSKQVADDLVVCNPCPKYNIIMLSPCVCLSYKENFTPLWFFVNMDMKKNIILLWNFSEVDLRHGCMLWACVFFILARISECNEGKGCDVGVLRRLLCLSQLKRCARCLWFLILVMAFTLLAQHEGQNSLDQIHAELWEKCHGDLEIIAANILGRNSV